jgi:hypothetical protein
MNRWGVYETLKSKGKADVVEVENTSAEEVKQGVIEYLLSREHDESIKAKGIDNLRHELCSSIEQYGTLDARTLEKSHELDKVIELEQLKHEVLYFMKRCKLAEKLLEENSVFCPIVQRNEISGFLRS